VKEKTLGRILVSTIGLGLVGLVIGYLIFGRIGGEFIALETLLKTPQNILGELGQKITGVADARQNILISGGVGAALGLVLGAVRR
jgi:hypothetical protein